MWNNFTPGHKSSRFRLKQFPLKHYRSSRKVCIHGIPAMGNSHLTAWLSHTHNQSISRYDAATPYGAIIVDKYRLDYALHRGRFLIHIGLKSFANFASLRKMKTSPQNYSSYIDFKFNFCLIVSNTVLNRQFTLSDEGWIEIKSKSCCWK